MGCRCSGPGWFRRGPGGFVVAPRSPGLGRTPLARVGPWSFQRKAPAQCHARLLQALSVEVDLGDLV
eukprot:10905058-Lingulodinium_polyedra.AAC.1